MQCVVRVAPTDAGVSEARVALLEWLHPLALTGSQRFALEFSTHEALVNALVHGIREGGGSSITLTVHADDERVRIAVKDDGVGFRWALPGLAAESPADEGSGSTGLGYELMRRLMTRVWFTTFQNGIIMELHRGRNRRCSSPAPVYPILSAPSA